MKTGSVFDDVPSKLDEEQFKDLVKGGGVCIKRIVSTGQMTGWFDPDDEEWVIVLRGSAVLRFEERDRKLDMGPGDWCTIPAGCRHRVEETSIREPTIWIAVHYKAS